MPSPSARTVPVLCSTAVFLLSAFAVGCDDSLIVEEEVLPLSEERSEAIVTSPEATAFFSLYDEWTDRVEAAVERGVSVSEMQALASQQSDDLNVILFGSQANADMFVERKQGVINRLMKAYPELATVDTEGAVERCEASDPILAQNLVEGLGSRATQPSDTVAGEAQARQDGPVCGSRWQQVKLLACAAVAGATCGPGAALCGWGCWCTLCSENSALADVMC